MPGILKKGPEAQRAAEAHGMTVSPIARFALPTSQSTGSPARVRSTAPPSSSSDGVRQNRSASRPEKSRRQRSAVRSGRNAENAMFAATEGYKGHVGALSPGSAW